MPKTTATTIAYFPNLPEFLEAGGFRVRLEVQRADGKPLTTADHKTLATLADGCEAEGNHTMDELSDMAEAALRAERKAGRKATERTKRAPKAAARMAKAPVRRPAKG